MAMEIFPCPKQRPLWWAKSRCGSSRDCIPDDRQPGGTFQEIVCNGINWVSIHETGWLEIWTPDNKRMVAKITARWNRADRRARCGITTGRAYVPGGYAEVDAFTVDIPGLTDVLKVKAWESKQLRYERYRRYQTARSTIPAPLQWIPPLLTKLDNAQDMIFTGLALAIPLIKRLSGRLIPGVGWLLLVNDILNLFT